MDLFQVEWRLVSPSFLEWYNVSLAKSEGGLLVPLTSFPTHFLFITLLIKVSILPYPPTQNIPILEGASDKH